MEIKKKKRIINDAPPKHKDAVEDVFRAHKEKRSNESFMKWKKPLFVVAILLGLFVVVLTFVNNDSNRIKGVAVSGNHYLDTRYVTELGGVNMKQCYYLVNTSAIRKKLLENPFISDAKVTHAPNNVILLEIEEKQPFGYRYTEQAEVLFTDGTIGELDSSNMGVVASIPLINGFLEDEAVHLLSNAFRELKRETIESISEVNQYELNYDDHTLEVYMDDGNYVFSSYYGLPMLNSYNDIVSQMDEKGVCLFTDDGQKLAYRKVCPWNETPKQTEYWVNENGEYVLNKYGDKVPVHYKKDENGEFLLDDEGNKIRIPIDIFGNEIPDPEPEEGEQATPTPTPTE